MCHLCGWIKLFLKNVRWKKIKIQKRWLLGQLSDVSFVQSLYVDFCRSFLLCRLLGLQVTVCGLAKVAIFTTNVDAENKCLINHKCLCEARNRHFCQTAVSSSGYWSSVIYLLNICRHNLQMLSKLMPVFAGLVLGKEIYLMSFFLSKYLSKSA